MKTFAISGKGGTGKSTISALIIRWIRNNRSKSILAVDADSNVNLNDLLGVETKETIGSIREEMKKSVSNLPGGMTKQEFLEYKIHSGLVESSDFDLLAMGRPEGPGCYCYANNLLRDILKTLSSNYQYVVIDNEAGMEHLSRRTAQNIDYLLLISNPSVRGIQAAGRISRLLTELDSRVKEQHLILNRTKDSLPESLKKIIEKENLKLLSMIPEDDSLISMDELGEPIWQISENSAAYLGVDQFMNKLLNRGKNDI